MRNIHVRTLAASVEQVRPWIAACWSGGELDSFPRDVIANWRTNPSGVPADALIPGQTMVGHGPFRFRLRTWDGVTWRVDVVGRLTGWHGFDLAPVGDGCRLTHTVELAASWRGWLAWKAIEPIHDWAVEAMFDRLEHALRTGAVPVRTTRPLPRRARLGLALARRRHRAGQGQVASGRAPSVAPKSIQSRPE